MTETIFAARGLSKKYGGVLALNGVNMEIKRGDIYGFAGENGAGKTTLIRILAGTAFKSGGDIALSGVNDDSKLSAQRRRVGGIIENPAVYPDLSAVENLEIVRLQLGIPVYLSTPKSARKSKTESRHRDELINGRKGYNYRTQRKPPT